MNTMPQAYESVTVAIETIPRDELTLAFVNS